MNETMHSGKQTHERRTYAWIYEVLLLVTVCPALVHGLGALSNLPVV